MTDWKGRIIGKVSKDNIGQTIVLNGWVNRQDLGQVIRELRDRSGLVQIVLILKSWGQSSLHWQNAAQRYVISVRALLGTSSRTGKTRNWPPGCGSSCV